MYHAIVEDRADGIRLGRFDDDREHITEVADVLLASNVADHTLMDDDQDVTLSLACDGEDFVLVIPDLSGETWEHALVERQWSKTLDDAIAAAAGFMIFVHCKEINGGTTIVEVEQAAVSLQDEGDDEAERTVEVGTDGPADNAPHDVDGDAWVSLEGEAEDETTHCKQLTQVSLVELIQFFAARSAGPIRVSIVISAWDLMPKKLTPAQWVAKNTPLLDQFLHANEDEVEAKVWGVSAQGAHLADPKIREEYKDKDPIDRAMVRTADGTQVGVAAPLRWVLRLDQ
jgi:hypothetical protein